VLAGSCAYAIAEAAGGADRSIRRPGRPGGFYLVLTTSVVLGIALTYVGLTPSTLLSRPP